MEKITYLQNGQWSLEKAISLTDKKQERKAKLQPTQLSNTHSMVAGHGDVDHHYPHNPKVRLSDRNPVSVSRPKGHNLNSGYKGPNDFHAYSVHDKDGKFLTTVPARTTDDGSVKVLLGLDGIPGYTPPVSGFSSTVKDQKTGQLGLGHKDYDHLWQDHHHVSAQYVIDQVTQAHLNHTKPK